MKNISRGLAVVLGVSILLSSVALAKTMTQTAGFSKVVLSATVIASTNASMDVRVDGVTKNAPSLKDSVITLAISKSTRITQSGKKIALAKINLGSKVKVFGKMNKSTKQVSPTWIKVK